MKIYTSYFGNRRKLEASGVVAVGICLYRPRYFSGVNISCVAPTRELFDLSDQPDSVYVPKFKKDVLSKVNPKEFVEQLKLIGGGKDVALCCYEKDSTQCHRAIVADWLNETLNLGVVEFGKEEKKEVQEDELKLF